MTFFELARKIAAGEEVVEDVAVQILETSGKTVEELREAVALVARFLAAAESCKDIEKLDANHEAAKAELAKAESDFAAFCELHRPNFLEFGQKIEDAKTALASAKRSLNDLRGLAGGHPDIVDALEIVIPSKPTPAPAPSNLPTPVAFG